MNDYTDDSIDNPTNVERGKHYVWSFSDKIVVAFCVTLLFMGAVLVRMDRNEHLEEESKSTNRSAWVARGQTLGSLQLKPVTTTSATWVSETETGAKSFHSPYTIHTPISQGMTFEHGILNVSTIKTIAIYDPQKLRKGLARSTFESCSCSNCQMTTDIKMADAVVFIMPKLQSEPNLTRRENQIWVMYTIEAPSRSNWFEILTTKTFRSAFNLTVSFSLDSDVPNPYGRLAYVGDTDNLNRKNYSAIFRNKFSNIAWFVSHCQTRSQRNEYVHRMMSRIDVDIFGMCGTLECRGSIPDSTNMGRSMRERVDATLCLPLLSSSYKFYLAFENTLCREYITEKFFKTFRGVDIIPVVRGGADYQKYFPAGTFVDASKFSTPESLADFLLDLAEDESRYIQYLRTKDRYRLELDSNMWKCDLCWKLHTMGHVTYPDIHDWWTRDKCFDPVDSIRVW